MSIEIATPKLRSAAVETRLNYVGPNTERPRYYATDTSRNVVSRDRQTVQVEDARSRGQPPSLTREGFELLTHTSAVADFHDPREVERVYFPEIERLIRQVSGAGHVAISGPALLRSSAKPSPVLRPARFVHMDVSHSTVDTVTDPYRPKDSKVRRFAHYTVWRTYSPPPQDTPLALCDARTVSDSERVDADAITDIDGSSESSSVVVLVRYNPQHRWSYFPNMTRDEALVFKTHDSDPDQPHSVPHSAFKDPSCPQGAVSRKSIEARAVAFWFGG